MKWLITGGCGFVGSNLADALLTQGREALVLDNLMRNGSRQNLDWLRGRHRGLRFLEADVRNAEAVAHVVRDFRPTAIAHLAGQVAMTTSIRDPRLDFETNALGTFNVLEAVRAHSPETVVLYSSTNKVYGDLAWVRFEEAATRYVAPDFPNGFDEDTPLSFHSPYGCSKGAADQYMQDYARMFGLRTVVFRHSAMYGGRQFATYDQGWIGWFCQKALETAAAVREGREAPEFTMTGNGKQVRDVLHADDVVALYTAAAAAPAAAGRAYNVGGGMANSLSLLELFAILEQELHVTLRPRSIEWRQGDQKVFVADLARCTRDIGWRPAVAARDGVRRTLAWLREGAGA